MHRNKYSVLGQTEVCGRNERTMPVGPYASSKMGCRSVGHFATALVVNGKMDDNRSPHIAAFVKIRAGR